MKQLSLICGVIGILLVVLGVIGRFKGQPQVFGWQAITFIIMGIAFMVMGCFIKLESK